MTGIVDQALEAAAKGWHVHPLKERGKAATWKGWEQKATTDPETIKYALKDGQNYGIACGPSRLLVIDEDTPGELEAITRDHGVKFPPTLTITTPNGGTHRIYHQGDLGLKNHCPFKKEIRIDGEPVNLGYDVDVRGVGGYIVGPGSHFIPNAEEVKKGKKEGYYTANDERVRVIDDDLIAALRGPDLLRPDRAHLAAPAAPPKPAAPTTVHPLDLIGKAGNISGDRPGDRFAAEHDTPEKLAAYMYQHDWQYSHEKDGKIYILRPGKNPGEIHSAAVEWRSELGRPGLWVFSTNTIFRPEYPYAPFAVYATMEHGGDFEAAAAALGRHYKAIDGHTPTGLPGAPQTSLDGHTDTVTDVLPSWKPVDLGPILEMMETGVDLTPRPAIGTINGAGFLLYQSAINGIYGEPGTGKTFTANAITAQELNAGNHVLHIDWEAGPTAIVNRLLTAGVHPDVLRKQFHYVQPETPFKVGGLALIDYAQKVKPSLVIIDSTGEAVANEGGNPNADEEIASWFQMLPAPLARTGAAVLVLDHAAKSEESSRKGPIGSQRKLAAITGAQYEQRVGSPFSKVQDGHANLIVKKDRHGTYTKGQTVAQLKIADAGTRLDLEAPSETFRPTGVMEKISFALQTNDGQIESFNALYNEVGGKRTIVQHAVQLLLQEGHIKQTSGPNRATQYVLLTPFTDSESVVIDL